MSEVPRDLNQRAKATVDAVIARTEGELEEVRVKVNLASMTLPLDPQIPAKVK